MKALLLLFLFVTISIAQKIEAQYDISYGIIGKLGYATTMLEKKQTQYYIRIEAYTTGIAKVLSGNRKEVYESRGEIVDNILVPYKYTQTKTTNKYRKVKKYTFDHLNEKVFLESYKRYNNEPAEHNKQGFNYYAKNDILTLYFNIIELLKQSHKNHNIFYAIGGKSDNGRIDVMRSEKNSDNLLELQVVINQDIFSSDNGVLQLQINKEKNICSGALLEDVLFFGDIVGKLTHPTDL